MKIVIVFLTTLASIIVIAVNEKPNQKTELTQYQIDDLKSDVFFNNDFKN